MYKKSNNVIKKVSGAIMSYIIITKKGFRCNNAIFYQFKFFPGAIMYLKRFQVQSL